MTVTARVTYTDPGDQHQLVKLSTGHEIQYGGIGDSYCYDHQSFDCWERMTEAEQAAAEAAR